MHVEVNKNGTEVSHFTVEPFPPNLCGTGGAPPKEVSTKGKVKNGNFKLTLFIVTDTGTKLPSEKVSGKFASHGNETGTMRPLKLPADCTGDIE